MRIRLLIILALLNLNVFASAEGEVELFDSVFPR